MPERGRGDEGTDGVSAGVQPGASADAAACPGSAGGSAEGEFHRRLPAPDSLADGIAGLWATDHQPRPSGAGAITTCASTPQEIPAPESCPCRVQTTGKPKENGLTEWHSKMI